MEERGRRRRRDEEVAQLEDVAEALAVVVRDLILISPRQRLRLGHVIREARRCKRLVVRPCDALRQRVDALRPAHIHADEKESRPVHAPQQMPFLGALQRAEDVRAPSGRAAAALPPPADLGDRRRSDGRRRPGQAADRVARVHVRGDAHLLGRLDQADRRAVGAGERALRGDLANEAADVDLLDLGVVAFPQRIAEHAADFLQVRADGAGEGEDDLEVAFSEVWKSVHRDWVDKNSRRTYKDKQGF